MAKELINNKDEHDRALQGLYSWISTIKFSKPKRNISRDFSDGVMIAEAVKHFYPKLVDLHNYTPASSTQRKLYNWKTLNVKVFSKLNFQVPDDTLKKIVLSTPGYIETVLWALREIVEGKNTDVLEGLQDIKYVVSEDLQTTMSGSIVDANAQPQAPLALWETVENAKVHPITKKGLSIDELQDLYAWIDKIEFSRPKKHISRDFSDGVMTAEVAKHFFPKLVDLYNYSPATSTQRKLNNWKTLNRKVFSKLNFHVPDDLLKEIVLSTPGYVEAVLWALKERVEAKHATKVSDGLQKKKYCSILNDDLQTTTSGSICGSRLPTSSFGCVGDCRGAGADQGIQNLCRLYHLDPKANSHLQEILTNLQGIGQHQPFLGKAHLPLTHWNLSSINISGASSA